MDKTHCKDKITCTQILHVLVILGCMFNYMLRVNLTIAIVEMASDQEDTNSTHSGLSNSEDNKFTWDKYDQNLILGSFFWGYVLTEMPSGRLSEVIGAKRVFGGSMVAASVLTLLTPAACQLGLSFLIALRCTLGLFLGTTIPTIPTMAVKWIPPMERSKFMAHILANALGSAITMPVSGLLISKWGWESVFYTTGSIGLVYSISWFFLMYDSPAKHPRISFIERQQIETAINKQNGLVGNRPKKVPWKAILSSSPVWAYIITHGLTLFGFLLILNELPTYMKEVLHFNVKMNGLLSSLPYLAKYGMAVISSSIADRLRRTGKLSTTATRKIFTVFSVWIPAFLVIILATLGNNPTIAVSVFICILFFNGAIAAGYLSSNLDIAPNFAGTIFGIANTLSSLGGFLSTFIVATLTPSKTFEEWSYVFWILFATYTLATIVFIVFGSGEIQPWNNDCTIPVVVKLQEIQPLQSKDGKHTPI